MNEHDRYADSLGAYMLGALPDPERDELERHLETCDRCRARAAALQPPVDALPMSATPMTAPPELKGRIMAIVEAEADVLRAAGSAADRVPAPRRRGLGLGRLFPRPLALAGAVAAALAVGVVGGGALLGGGGSPQPAGSVVAAHITDPSVPRTATAFLRVRSGRASLVVRNLPDPPPNRVYQVWVKSSAEPSVPAGATFALRSGTIDIPHTVRRSQEVLVTSEPVGGSASPTRSPLIIAGSAPA